MPKPYKCDAVGANSESQGLAKEQVKTHSSAKDGQYGEAIAVHDLPPGPAPLKVRWGFVHTQNLLNSSIALKLAAIPVGFFHGAPNQQTST